MRKMLNAMTRGKVIRAWLGAAVLAIVWNIAFGAEMSLRATVLLFALCLVPPVLVLRLWPPPLPYFDETGVLHKERSS